MPRFDTTLSVVMAVYNGGEQLAKSLESVLAQRECSEFVVVDDGSTDETPRTLGRFAARDPRLKVLEQSNRGLTASLVRGCEAASGEYIARQDAGDISRPGRFARLLERAESEPDAVLVSSASRFVGPGGEPLFVAPRTDAEARNGLGRLTLEDARCPAHGAVLFRRRDYLRAGGYRTHFRFAQDLDLWLRLMEIGGTHVVVPEVLYEVHLCPLSISLTRRAEQREAAELALTCARQRRAGQAETHTLLEAARHAELCATAKPGAITRRRRRAEGYYFIGSCLRNSDPVSARRYFGRAIKSNPLHWRALGRLLLGARPDFANSGAG